MQTAPPPDSMYVCLLCGKTAVDCAELKHSHYMWDENCAVRAILCRRPEGFRIGQSLTKVEVYPEQKHG
jgi:hypothetical protein